MSKKARHIQVPQYEGLSLKVIAQYLNEHHPEVFTYFPDAQEIHKVNKEWICNICVSVIGDDFEVWVKNQIEQRNAGVVTKKKLNIEMDDEIAAAFRASSKVSCKCLYQSIY